MRFFSTFTGIGGFEIGIHNAYIKRTLVSTKPEPKVSKPGGKWPLDEPELQLRAGDWATPLCVGYSEIDKYAISVYEKQFKGAKNYGDITKIDTNELPEFDCLVGGFPCQAFSVAGKRKGFDDTRGTLFFDLARILQAKRPRLFVFENVKGLLSHDSGKTFATIIAAVSQLGYDCQWQVLNSKNHGVPQNRERIIIVGHLRGEPRPQVFPFTGADSAYSKELSSTALDANYWKGIDNHGQRTAIAIGTFRTYKDGNGFREMKSGVSPTLGARAREDGRGQPVVAIPVLTPNRAVKRQNGRRFKNDGEPHFTVNTQDRHGIYDGLRIRRLTPLECERLQAFPDNWTQYSATLCEDSNCGHGVTNLEHYNLNTVSDTQRYKMCGNAVTTNVIQSVFEKIFEKKGAI